MEMPLSDMRWFAERLEEQRSEEAAAHKAASNGK